MKERNAYSRMVQSVADWEDLKKGKIIELFQSCVEHNITSFVHESYFKRRKTGELLGTALSESGLSRDEIQLISKMPEKDHENLSFAEAVDNELLVLETDYLDLFLLHRKDLTSENLSEIERLSAQGKLKEIGGIDFEPAHIEQLQSFVPVHANFIKPEADFLQVAQELQKTSFGTLDFFIWLRKSYFSEKTEGQKAFAEELAEKYEVSPFQIFLSWILKQYQNVHPVLQFSDEEKIAAAANSKHIFLAPKDADKMFQLFS